MAKVKEWEKVTLRGEFVDLSMFAKGEIDLANIHFDLTEKQQLTLISNFKLGQIIKFKIKLFLKRILDWVMRANDERAKPYVLNAELKGAKRYFKDLNDNKK